jgi:hypothetical protein
VRLLAFVALVASAAACHRQPAADLTPITAEDESLRKDESDLVGQRGMLQRERKKLADARAELAERRTQIGHDSAGQAALEEEEKKLAARDSDLSREEQKVDDRLGQLFKQREALVQRVTAVTTTSASDPLERAARREQSVATREKDLAARERELAEREQALASRESQLARRERDTCGAVAAPGQKVEPQKGLHYGAHDVEPVYKKALKLMQERGLLNSDLPPGASKLVDETRDAMKKADYVRAKYDADQLLATVEEIKIDRSFISAKMARLSAAMRGKKLEGSDRKVLEDLFQEATANYGDGKFPQANSKINRLFALLKAG